jgi:HK97 family phage prohead protease
MTTVAKALEDKERVVRFVGTTGVRDRMGDEIPTKGWNFDPYLKNPVVMWGHNYAEPPVGRVTEIHEKGGKQPRIEFDVEFAPGDANPKAEQLFQLTKRGFLNAVSVGFRSLKSEWIDTEDEEEKKRAKEAPDARAGKEFKKKELLELSLVPVPANPEALIAARQKGLEVPEELGVYLDKLEEIVQQRAALETTRALKERLASDNEPEMTHVYTPAELFDGESFIDHVREYKDEILKVLGIDQLQAEIDAGKDIADVAEAKPGWDVTESSIRYRVREPDGFEKDSFRTVSLQKRKPRVSAVMGKLVGSDTMKIQSLIFPQSDGWTTTKAKAWVSAHPGVLKAAEVACGLEWFVESEDVAQPAEGSSETAELEEVITKAEDSVATPEPENAETTSEERQENIRIVGW